MHDGLVTLGHPNIDMINTTITITELACAGCVAAATSWLGFHLGPSDRVYPGHDEGGPESVWYYVPEDEQADIGQADMGSRPFVWLSRRGLYLSHSMPEREVCLAAGYALLHGIRIYTPEIVDHWRQDAAAKKPTPAKKKALPSATVTAFPSKQPTKH